MHFDAVTDCNCNGDCHGNADTVPDRDTFSKPDSERNRDTYHNPGRDCDAGTSPQSLDPSAGSVRC